MTIAFQCPHCHERLSAPRALAGHVIRCQECQHAFTIPVDSPLAPPLPPPSSGAAVVMAAPPPPTRALEWERPSNERRQAGLHWLTKTLTAGWLAIAAIVFLVMAVGISVQTGTVLVPGITALVVVVLYMAITSPFMMVGLAMLHYGLKQKPGVSVGLNRILAGMGGLITALGYLLAAGFMIWSAKGAQGTFHPPDHPVEKAKQIARYEQNVKTNLHRADDAFPKMKAAIGEYERARKDTWTSSSRRRQIHDRGETIAREYLDAIRDLDYYWQLLDKSVHELQSPSELLDDPQIQQQITKHLLWLQKYDEVTSDPEKRFEIWLKSLQR